MIKLVIAASRVFANLAQTVSIFQLTGVFILTHIQSNNTALTDDIYTVIKMPTQRRLSFIRSNCSQGFSTFMPHHWVLHSILEVLSQCSRGSRLLHLSKHVCNFMAEKCTITALQTYKNIKCLISIVYDSYLLLA